MPTKLIVAITLAAAAFLSLPAQNARKAEAGNLPARAAEREGLGADFATEAYRNPALMRFRYATSLTAVTGNYSHRSETVALDLQRGNKSNHGAFDAHTYILYKESALWGAASYANGQTSGVRYNETSDPELLYPYVLADTTVGAMKQERYAFSGGYADFNGRVGWGATLGYEAGLDYRNIDPRPRNVTGHLTAALGLSAKVMENYAFGASAHFQRYQQTNDVEFLSEMGQEKLYHFTGLDNDYARFAGTAYDTYYKGYLYGLGFQLLPLNASGFTATFGINRFTFDNILSDLNELPLASAIHDRLSATLTYKWRTTGGDVLMLKAVAATSRRRGRENLFGDAASGVYPKIGQLDLFYHFRKEASLALLWAKTCGQFTVEAAPSLGYVHDNTIYALPRSSRLINSMTWGVQAKAMLRSGKALHSLSAGYAAREVLGSELILASGTDNPSTAARLTMSNFRFESRRSSVLNLGLSTHIPIARQYALTARLGWQHGFHAFNVGSDRLQASLGVEF